MPGRRRTGDDLREQTNRFIGWMVAIDASLVIAVSLIVSLARAAMSRPPGRGEAAR